MPFTFPMHTPSTFAAARRVEAVTEAHRLVSPPSRAFRVRRRSLGRPSRNDALAGLDVIAHAEERGLIRLDLGPPPARPIQHLGA